MDHGRAGVVITYGIPGQAKVCRLRLGISSLHGKSMGKIQLYCCSLRYTLGFTYLNYRVDLEGGGILRY